MSPIYELPWSSKCQWQGGPLCCRDGEGPYSGRWWESLKPCFQSSLHFQLCSQSQHEAEGWYAGYTLELPFSTDPLINGNWGLGWSPHKGGEEWGRKACAFWDSPHLCNCRLPMTTSCRERTPTKEDPEKRKQHEKLGSGEGGQGHTEPRQSWDGGVWEWMSVWLSNMLLYQHSWALFWIHSFPFSVVSRGRNLCFPTTQATVLWLS